jgi:hypothetical protein
VLVSNQSKINISLFLSVSFTEEIEHLQIYTKWGRYIPGKAGANYRALSNIQQMQMMSMFSFQGVTTHAHKNLEMLI